MSTWLRANLTGWLCCASAAAAWAADESRPVAQFGTGLSEEWPAEEPHLLQTWLPEWHETMARHGVHPTFRYYGEVVGNVSGGLNTGAVYEGLAEGEVQFDLERLGAWSGLSAALSFVVPHGDSPTTELVGDLFGVSNIAAGNDIRLYDLWLEQSFAANAVSLRVGKFASDEEFALTDLGSFFVNSSFGWPAFLGANVPAPSYPAPTPGVRLRWDITERCWVQAAIFNGDPAPLDAGGRPADPNGLRFDQVNGAFGIQELGVRWDTPARPHGLLKVGGWYHTGDFTELSDSFAANPRLQEGTWGLYLAAEQTLWPANPEAADLDEQGLHAFLRAGFAPTDVNLVGHYLEGGLRYTGLLPGREEDSFGVGCVYGRISEDYRDAFALSQIGSLTPQPLPDHELVMECSYQFRLTSSWVLQPDAQWVHHPGGSAALPDAWVLTLRTILSF